MRDVFRLDAWKQVLEAEGQRLRSHPWVLRSCKAISYILAIVWFIYPSFLTFMAAWPFFIPATIEWFTRDDPEGTAFLEREAARLTLNDIKSRGDDVVGDYVPIKQPSITQVKQMLSIATANEEHRLGQEPGAIDVQASLEKVTGSPDGMRRDDTSERGLSGAIGTHADLN